MSGLLVFPKFGFDNAPHSPLAAGFNRSQSATKLPFVSRPRSVGVCAEVSVSRGAVEQPLVDGVGRRHVASDEELRRRLAVAEHVVGGAEPRLDIVQTQRAVPLCERHGGRNEDVRPDRLVAEVVAQVLEAQAALQ